MNLSGIRSMTGFANRTLSIAGISYKFELKSLNHRYLEVKIRMPRDWSPFEIDLRKEVENYFRRGSVEISIERVSRIEEKTTIPRLDMRVAEGVYQQLVELGNRLGKPSAEVTLADIIRAPDVWARDDQTASQDLSESLEATKIEVLKQLNFLLVDAVVFRETEGGRLKAALNEILNSLNQKLIEIDESRKFGRARIQERIQKRLEVFQGATQGEAWHEMVKQALETRVAQEVSFLLERADIEEEMTRFRGHLEELKRVINGPVVNAAGDPTPVGKKIDFLLQELGREVNTLGNKAQDYGISDRVVQMKLDIDRIREQNLNLE